MRSTRIRQLFRLTTMLMVAASPLALAAAPAVGSSIVYIGSDGNVHLTSPDGSIKKQVTRDGTPQDRYRSPSQTDDGKLAAIRKVGSSGVLYLLDRQSGQPIDNWILPRTGAGSFTPLFGGEISPGGALFVYDWNYFDCSDGCRTELRVSFVAGPGQTDPCTITCHSGYIRPRWIPGTPYAGFINSDFSGITVQTPTGPTFWFGFDGAMILGFDVEGDRTLVVSEAADVRALAVVQNGGTPPTPAPQVLCTVQGFSGGELVRWAPDGTMIAWEGTDGVYVSPAPAETGGGTCTLQPRLVAPGGSAPDWGPADVAADPAANTAASTPPPLPADTTKPVLRSLKLSPIRFTAANSGPSIVSRRGSTVSYKLSEAAVVRFTVQRATLGRRIRGRCVKETRATRRARRCTRYQLHHGTFNHRGSSGQNRFKFSGRLRNRKLAPGRYRLEAMATDAAGNRSRVTHTRFQIRAVRASRRR